MTATRVHPLKERDGVVDEDCGLPPGIRGEDFPHRTVGHYLKTTGGLAAGTPWRSASPRKLFEFYAADGQYKYHCAYGAEAQCGGCGCSQVPLMHAMKSGTWKPAKWPIALLGFVSISQGYYAVYLLTRF